MNPRDRILVALDTPQKAQALAWAKELKGAIGGVKIGLELYTSFGPDIVKAIQDEGHRIFLDLKLHDIPNTVRSTARVIGRLGVDWFTLHASGGTAMMEAAVEGAQAKAASVDTAPKAIAVTILTSHDDASIDSLGWSGPCSKAVLRLTRLAKASGVAGIVCSAKEVSSVHQEFHQGLKIVPGIRPLGASADDQARVATPFAAVSDGADYLVIGRPITQAPDPRKAAEAIITELEGQEALR